jgi:hypothetical protein
MVAVVDTIDLVHPSDTATGVPLNNTIQITFDREIDEWSIEHGGLVLEGPDTDLVIYPGYTPTTLISGTEPEILQSPGLKGVVPGVFTFQRIALLTTDPVNTSDTSGDGTLFRTRVTFKPTEPLKALTGYTLYLVGDDDNTDAEVFGLRSRTVFDGVAGTNTGDGQVTFSGTYLGNLISDTLNIRITKTGVAGVAEFETWMSSQPLDLLGPFLTSSTESQAMNGVSVQFLDGEFEVDDTFTVFVKRPVIYTGTVVSTFTTGNGSITVVPTSTATSPTGDPILSTLGDVFKIVETAPEDGTSNLTMTGNRRITIEFNNSIDPTTVSSDTVEVLVEPVSDHPALSQVPAGPISHTLTVSGNKLFIDL